MAILPPHAVLSEQLEEQVRGRHLIAAAFLTYQFDPEFFEQEILPVFVDMPLSHAAPIKLVQLDEAIKNVQDGIAVYYDQNGLAAEAGPAKLDIRRIPIRHRTGIFHPKNIFALVEEQGADDEETKERSLLVVSLSANLTRSGWWENVEACHIEELSEGESTRLREDLIGFLDGLERRAGDKAADDHRTLRAIKGFLRTTQQRGQRTSKGALHPHFFDGRTSFPAFLREVAGPTLDGAYLEVISPYFDEKPEHGPLYELVDQFNPKEVQVYLPRESDGSAGCSKEVYESILDLPGVSWARMPQELLRSGKSEDAIQRRVHAKVYRFFKQNPKQEIVFVGSVNLTGPAHRSGGNLETGFLVEIEPQRRPDWWLIPETSKPKEFKEKREDEGTSTRGGTRLCVRFHWNTLKGEAYWDDGDPSPDLKVLEKEIEIFKLSSLPARQWQALPEEANVELKRALQSTSILWVEGEEPEPGILLVQEEGMYCRPSLLLELTPADVLRYWALLTPAQKAAFIESRAPEAALMGDGASLVAPRYILAGGERSFFEKFAGIFLSFGCLERSVRTALAEKKYDAAIYRIFGKKYDSLGYFLDRVIKEQVEDKGDCIDQYVSFLCAKQLVQELGRDFPEFWRENAEGVRDLKEQLNAIQGLREKLVVRQPEEMPAFLDWFERWFLKRAKPVERNEQ